MKKTKNRRVVRQGDVLFIPISKKPSGRPSKGSRIVMQGEATGHAHKLSGTEGTLYLDEQGRVVGLANAKPSSPVVHEEHGPAHLEGDYSIVIQEEYDPETGRRQVAD